MDEWILKKDLSGFHIRWSTVTAERYISEGFWTNESLAKIANRRCVEQPDKVLLIEGQNSFTRIDIWSKAIALSSYFSSIGLEMGDVISFQLPNWNEAVVIALAARLSGIVINPIPPIYRQSELQYILNDCGAKLIFIPHIYRKNDYVEMLRALKTRLPKLEHVVVVRGDNMEFEKWDQCLSLTTETITAPSELDPASVTMVMYTSGTTGRPKGVLHTHYSYDYRVRGMASAWNINSSDVIFMPSPVTHITGAFWAIDMPWICGGTSVLLDTWTPEEGIRCIDQFGCTVSGGATPFLQQLLDGCEPNSAALSSLRLFFCGGTTVSPELILSASRQFPDCLFFRAYGSTEMPTTTAGIRHAEDASLGAWTDGEVVYPTQVKIVDAENGNEVPFGTEGEILARGPEQFAGYLHPDDNSSAFTEDGYFRTGDLGRWDRDNFLVITGRKKDIIIRSGENISPKEVEDALYLHPSIADVAIVAMPSKTTGEIGCAFVIVHPGHTINLAEIQRFLDGQGIARQKIPEHIELVDELPRVPSGKIRKDVLRVRARQIAEVN